MQGTRSALVLLIFALIVPSAMAQNPVPKLTYLSEAIDLTLLIPPPPPPNSQAHKEDLAAVLEMQERRTDVQVKRATDDNVLSIWRFQDVMGPNFTKEKLPVFDAFMERAQGDARVVLIAAKNALQRPRPALVSTDVLALGGTPRLPTAYPSGGVVFTTLTAILVARMVPEKRFELSERNWEYAINRVVLGQHFPRDIRAGEIAGTVVAHALMEKPEFMKDFEAARVELRKVIGLPPEPPAPPKTPPAK
jgi:acid phosphatase (class A)